MRVTTGLILLTLAFALGAAGQEADVRAPYRLSLPFRDWALDVDFAALHAPPRDDDKADKRRLFPLRKQVESVSEDGNTYQFWVFQGAPRRTYDLIRIMFRPAQTDGTAADFRDYALKHPGGGVKVKGSPKTWEYKEIPVARYAVDLKYHVSPPFSGGVILPVSLSGPRKLEAYLVRDGVWVSVELLADDLGEREERLFYGLLDTLKFVDTSAPSTSFDYYHKGRTLYLTGEYPKAAEALTAALSLEHRQRQLDTPSWRDLVSKLIDSLAVTADWKRAKELMDYAVARDPGYPAFHLALARYHAKLGELDNAIARLEQAFLHGENALPGQLIDPLRDPTFERFHKDERFRKAAKALTKKHKR